MIGGPDREGSGEGSRGLGNMLMTKRPHPRHTTKVTAADCHTLNGSHRRHSAAPAVASADTGGPASQNQMPMNDAPSSGFSLNARTLAAAPEAVEIMEPATPAATAQATALRPVGCLGPSLETTPVEAEPWETPIPHATPAGTGMGGRWRLLWMAVIGVWLVLKPDSRQLLTRKTGSE